MTTPTAAAMRAAIQVVTLLNGCDGAIPKSCYTIGHAIDNEFRAVVSALRDCLAEIETDAIAQDSVRAAKRRRELEIIARAALAKVTT